MKSKVAGVLILALLIALFLPACSASDPLTEDIYTSGNVYPSTDNTSSLGSANRAFKEGHFRGLYVDNTTLYLGGVPFTGGGAQGEPGPQGPKGDTGDNGTAGYTPVKGIDYFDGAKGDKGDTGDNGTAGSPGDPGPNTVTENTTTTITGLLKGASGNVTQAIVDTDYSPPYANKTTLAAITEAFTTTLKATYDGLVSASHTHSNMTTLNNITAAFTTALKASYDAAVTASHSHSNQSVLDATQQSFTTALKTSYDWLVTNITQAWKTTVDNFIASKGAASGLAPLDANSKVPTVNLGGAGADNTKYLRGDQTWQVPAGGGESEIVVVLGADVANATVNLANATGLSFSADANSTYIIEVFLLWDTSATTVGIKVSATATNSPTIQSGQFITDAASGTPDSSSWNANDVVVTTSASPFTTFSMGKVAAVLKTSGSGSTWQLRFAAETTGTITIKAGSALRYRKVA